MKLKNILGKINLESKKYFFGRIPQGSELDKTTRHVMGKLLGTVQSYARRHPISEIRDKRLRHEIEMSMKNIFINVF